MLAGSLVGVPVKWIEDRRENLMAAGKSRLEHAGATLALSTATATSSPPRSTSSSDCGAYPRRGRWAPSAAIGMLFPWSVHGCRPPRSRPKTVYSNTAGRNAYRGPWQFETLACEVLLDTSRHASSPSTRWTSAGATSFGAMNCRSTTRTA